MQEVAGVDERQQRQPRGEQRRRTIAAEAHALIVPESPRGRMNIGTMKNSEGEHVGHSVLA